ncbi:MAG: DUF2066 domain-containing protein [Pseudomonadota bacterium]
MERVTLTGARRGRLIPFGTLLVLAGLLVSAVARAELVTWLYDVSVPVTNQSAAARSEAAGNALRELLMRVSGVAELPESPVLAAALARPTPYYRSFEYRRRTVAAAPLTERDGASPDGAPPVRQLEVAFTFAQAPVLKLVKALELPIWLRNRPRVVPWVRVGDDALVLAASGPDSSPSSPAQVVAEAMVNHALKRGLPLTLPTTDTDGQVPTVPASLERLSALELSTLSTGLGGELFGRGRIERIGTRLSAQLEFTDLLGELTLPVAVRADTPAELGTAIVDALADGLASRYAASGGGLVRLEVRGVATPGAYVELLRYLRGRSYLGTLKVLESGNGALLLEIDSQAGVEQLADLFAVDGRLAEPLDLGSQTPLRFGAAVYDWQG